MNNNSNYLYEKFDFSEEYKNNLIEFLKHNTNVEIGGYRIFDGSRTHLMQSPYELSDFIIELKKYEKNNNIILKSFLEIGFSTGINNTILNKFFNFEAIVGIDYFHSDITGYNLVANLLFKNLTLLCGDTTNQRTIKKAEILGPYDLIFIDANHEYKYVKKDFYNYIPFLNKKGVVCFHDIACSDWPGVGKFWQELKRSGKFETKEFIKTGFKIQYGIGMLNKKNI